MNKLSLILTLTTLFLVLVVVTVAIDTNHFGVCLPVRCGDTIITYPFYIPKKQEDFCGYPGFKVICKNGKIPLVNISGDSYVIRNIWYQNQSFEVANSALVNSVENNCSDSIRNLTLQNDIYKFPHSYRSIILLPNCTDKILGEYVNDRFKCGALGFYEGDHKLKNLTKECGGQVVSVPYEGESGGDIAKLLSRGIVLNWTANNCTACTESGGQCGFSRNTHLPLCYCHDRAHSYHCVHKNKKVGLIIGLGISGGIILLIAALVALWYRKKLKFGHLNFVSSSVSLERSQSELERGNIYFGVPLFSYSELEEATDRFAQSRELGDGGFGTVYYGKLKDGREVAVKRLFEKSYKRVEQFINEVQILTCLRHQNLVSLYGCTSHHCRELLLVYEYVPNGTVADHLYGDKMKPGGLPWDVRLRIAIETASALSYLHASDIIHRDVKTNNILLDSSFSVKVADFGLSRLFPTDVTHVSTAPQGTPGYLDPEYHQCYQLTDKSDVYSFGVVLIELISSLPAVDMERHRQEINLSNYAMSRIQRCAFDELVDLQLGFMSDFKVRKMTISVAELAFQCLQHDKEFRPSMDEVSEGLRRIESVDYEALKAEEAAKNDGNLVKNICRPPSSPSEDDDAKELLANNHHLPHPSSPNSVMDKWGSRSTTPSTSKILKSPNPRFKSPLKTIREGGG